MYPDELKNKKQWVIVNKNSKIPLNPFTLEMGSTANPDTWGTFEDVEKYINDYDLGFVFNDTDLIGIDIDKGFDSTGLPSEMAIDIMNKCNSYTELSRSGRGIHILVKGQLKFKGKNNRKGVEIYQTGRYFIMTGKTIGFKDIIENQEAIDYVVDTYFEETITSGKSDAFYSPQFELSSTGVVKITYPIVTEGGRNLSLLSYGGQLLSLGYSFSQLYEELCIVNEIAMNPKLTDREVQMITKNIEKYRSKNGK